VASRPGTPNHQRHGQATYQQEDCPLIERREHALLAATDAKRQNNNTTCAFIVSLDTEADNEWGPAAVPTYTSIGVLPKFQSLCDRYGVKPTYLVTHDVAADRTALTILRQLAKHAKCEIGAHMHGWRTPPFYPPLDSGECCHPYLYDYPRDMQAEKVLNLTQHLEQVFQTPMTSHRAGRWGIDAYGLDLLEANHYIVDSSVTPFRSWVHQQGGPGGKGGPSFLRAPTRPYRPAANAVERPGQRGILEVPISARVLGLLVRVYGRRELASLLNDEGFAQRNVRRACRRLGLAELVTLNPAVHQIGSITSLCRQLISQGEPVINMAFHSSELIAGGSPEIRNVADQERVWEVLDRFFALISDFPSVKKQTLSEYARQYGETVQTPE